MRPMLTSKIRLHFKVCKVQTMSQVVAAMSKHLTASQALRRFESKIKYDEKRRPNRRPIRKSKIETGKRVCVSDAVTALVRSNFLVKIGPSTYKLVENEKETQ